MAPATSKVKPAVIPTTFNMESPTPLIVPLNFRGLNLFDFLGFAKKPVPLSNPFEVGNIRL